MWSFCWYGAAGLCCWGWRGSAVSLILFFSRRWVSCLLNFLRPTSHARDCRVPPSLVCRQRWPRFASSLPLPPAYHLVSEKGRMMAWIIPWFIYLFFAAPVPYSCNPSCTYTSIWKASVGHFWWTPAYFQPLVVWRSALLSSSSKKKAWPELPISSWATQYCPLEFGAMFLDRGTGKAIGVADPMGYCALT